MRKINSLVKLVKNNAKAYKKMSNIPTTIQIIDNLGNIINEKDIDLSIFKKHKELTFHKNEKVNLGDSKRIS